MTLRNKPYPPPPAAFGPDTLKKAADHGGLFIFSFNSGASYAVGSLNELFSETMRLNTGASGVESFASTQK